MKEIISIFEKHSSLYIPPFPKNPLPPEKTLPLPKNTLKKNLKNILLDFTDVLEVVLEILPRGTEGEISNEHLGVSLLLGESLTLTLANGTFDGAKIMRL